MFNIVVRCSVLVIVSFGLTACQPNFWKKKEPPPPPAPAPVVQAPAPLTKDQQAAKLLILNGEYTLAHNQLLTPANDNAFDYFREIGRAHV